MKAVLIPGLLVLTLLLSAVPLSAHHQWPVSRTRLVTVKGTGTGYQFADGQKIFRLERVVLANGKEIRVYGR